MPINVRNWVLLVTCAVVGAAFTYADEADKLRVASKLEHSSSTANITGDWPQWGGTSLRNNTPVGTNIPTEWDVGGFDRKTGQWLSADAQNILWVSPVGSQTYGNPVVAGGRVFVGTNNSHGYLARYPREDLGCLIAFDQTDGKFLWQHSSEKLLTGRVHDWPMQGICCAPLVEGKRLWFVSSRGEVLCLDTEGFHDGEDDGPRQAGWGRLFKDAPQLTAALNAETLPEALHALLAEQGIPLSGRVRVTSSNLPENVWLLTVGRNENEQHFRIRVESEQLVVEPWSKDEAQATGDPVAQVPVDLTAGLQAGKASIALMALLNKRGMPISGDAQIKTLQPNRKWSIVAMVGGVQRELEVRREGPNVSAYKQITVDDKQEADEIWVFDMMGELGVSQHNMCSCSVTAWGDILFVNTSNGVDESHYNIPALDAPSFIAMDKNTGKVLWTDASPGANILHGQWSSPTVGEMGGVAQVIFAGGDGWVYSFRADEGKDGQPELLWKFDANPKDSEWILGGRGTRNNIIATPVIYKERVYVAVGQDPEHGEGVGHLWCLDPTKRGDVSPQKVVHVNDRTQVVPHRRIKAMNPEEGEIAIDNPNSAVIWHYAQFDQNGDGEFDFEESMHRSCGTVAIKDDLLYISDFSGLFHCLDAMTGKVHWTYDMLAAAWGSPLIVDGKVYVGDEDGELSVFQLSAEPHEPLAEINMLNSVYSTPIVSHNVLYISNRTHLFAIKQE